MLAKTFGVRAGDADDLVFDSGHQVSLSTFFFPLSCFEAGLPSESPSHYVRRPHSWSKFFAISTRAHSQIKQTNLNHFVARFTSRPWLMGTNHFYELSIEKSLVRAMRAGPKNWGGEARLYSQHVEDAFEKIEVKLARFHEKLKSSSDLTADERYGWSMWLLASYLRTPAAFLSSAEMSELMNNFAGDLFQSAYTVLAKCVTNPNCIELIANRNWQVITCDKPYFLKPDSGVVLTDRLDERNGLILYPLSPFSCFVATGTGRRFTRIPASFERVFELNHQILSWSDRSVACTTQSWQRNEDRLRQAVVTHLAAGKYSPPTSGRFFSIETVKSDGKIRATILGPKGPSIMTVSESAIRPVEGIAQPKIPGLYDVEDSQSIAFEVRFSDDESEVDYATAAKLMMKIGQTAFAVDFARKALEVNKEDLPSKLVLLASDSEADIGELIPKDASEAAELAIWWALAKHQPIEGLKITSTWLRRYRDHERLAQANFLCCFMVYGATFLEALCGRVEKPPYLDDDTPLPDGVIELVKKIYSHSDTDMVSEVQKQIGKMDINASGIAADILRVCGLTSKIRLYRKS